MCTTVKALTFLLLILNKVTPLLCAEARIVGGTPAQVGQFPWMAMLLANRSLCGGSIIDNQHVLTAAHCVNRAQTRRADRNGGVSVRYLDTSGITIIAGKHLFNSSKSYAGEQRVEIESGIYHEKYLQDLGEYSNDIAVLRLKRPLTFDSGVKAIPLASRSSPLPPRCIVAGWGRTIGTVPNSFPDWLMWVELSAYNRASCVNRVPGLNMSLNSMCLTSDTHDGVQVCNGDSGGPAFCRLLSSDPFEQYGLVSWGKLGCPARRGVPAVFTYVPAYITWIYDTINSLSSPCASNPCPASQTCREVGSTYTCECCACPEGMYGTNCRECGGTLTAPAGNLSSPEFPSYYKSNLACKWTIVVPPGQKVELTFHDIGPLLEAESCNDYVLVEDTLTNRSRTQCASYETLSLTYQGTLNISFHSDSDTSNDYVGFMASYKLINTSPAAVVEGSILVMAVAFLTTRLD